MSIKVFCEHCHKVFDEEAQQSECPHKKIGDTVLAVRADGKSAIVPKTEVVKYIAMKDASGLPVELKLVVQRKDGVVPDRIEISHGTVFTTDLGQRFAVHVPLWARVKRWLKRILRRP